MTISADTPHMAAVDRAKLLSLPLSKQTLGEFSFDGTILALWHQGLDTLAISKALGVVDYPESRVANRLAVLRDARAL